MLTLLMYLLLGAVAGTLAGLFGIGGGVIMVPALILAFAGLGVSFDVLVHLAVGTSLAAIVPTAISSAWAHHQRGSVNWRQVRLLVPGLVAGAIAGAYTTSIMSGDLLQKVIGVFLFCLGLQMLLSLKPRAGAADVSVPVLVAAGGVIGWASSIFGIGGGSLSVPFLVWCRSTMHQAVGTAATVGLPISVAGALGNVLTGWQNEGLPTGATGYVYWPAVLGMVLASIPFARLGVRLAYHLSEKLLKRSFAVFLLLMGGHLLLS